MLLFLAVAALAGPAELAETLALDLWRDGVHGDEAALRQAYQAECDEGSDTACKNRRWYSSVGPDLARAADQLKQNCKDGDAAACLVNGWKLSQVRPGVLSPEASDPLLARRLFQVGCDGGLQRACAELGWMALQGVAGEADPQLALSLLGTACEAGVRPACGGAAEASAARNEPQAVARWLARGEGHGAVKLAQGRIAAAAGKRGSAERAFLAACDAGAPMGCTLAAGGAPSLLERACDAGEGDACGEIATMVDLERAQVLAERACAYDSASGCRVQSEVLLGKAARGLDQPGDVITAERALAKACRIGDGQACFALGQADPHHGLPHVERACRLGHEPACNGLLAVFLLSDPPRVKDVLDWAEPRCAEGDPTQCLYAATGWWRLGPVHFETAVGFWNAACDLGDDLGCALRGRTAEFGIHRPHDPAAALEVYRTACTDLEGGYTCTELGHTHMRESVEDRSDAVRWYREGCERGDAAGCMALIELRRAQGHAETSLVHLLEGACFHDNGYAEQCVALDAALLASGETNAYSRGNAALVRACNMGMLSTCPKHKRVARWPWPVPSGPALDAERNRCHLRDDRNCLLEFTKALLGDTPEGWLLEQYAHLVMPACLIDPSLCRYEAARETLSARSVDLYERACFEGNDTESCMRAALFYDQGLGEPKSKRHVLDLASRACTVAETDREHCYGLPELMERWPGGPVETTRALVALCRTTAPRACFDAGNRVLGGVGLEEGDPHVAYDLLLIGCARADDYEACKRLKAVGREARSGQEAEVFDLSKIIDGDLDGVDDPQGTPDGGGPDF
ncbi:MAG: TPR repeat protein [Myxococcota bacterium]|jgi:TPR repeat protein